jgi:hypothetical protein
MRLFPRRSSPIGAAGDLGSFFSARRPGDLWMIVPALALTALIVWMLIVEYPSQPAPYKRNIIYVESWPLNRSDADIRAAQIADINNKKRALIQPKIEHNQSMLQFRRADKWLTAHGF